MNIVIQTRDMNLAIPRYGSKKEIPISEQTSARLYDISCWSGYPMTTLADVLLNIAMDNVIPSDSHDSVYEWLKKNEVV